MRSFFPTFRTTSLFFSTLVSVTAVASASAAVLPVGPNKTYATPCRAFAAAAAGDIVEIDAAGTYTGDVCGIYPSNLTIRGVNGRPKINANGANAMGKGTWVIVGSNTVIENVEMLGARVADRNGAAIRLEGRHLTLRGSYLHDNENGILTSNDGVSDIIIENTEFGSNGYGDGYSHNLYVGRVNSLVFKGSHSHDANVGHNLKSRAKTNTIVYSRFSSSTGQPSYEIDLPNAGTAYVIGNVIHQPASHRNPTLLAYGAEGATNPGQDLYVVNNTFLNDDSSRGTFIMVGSGVITPVLMQNNIFAGTGTVMTQGIAVDRTNYRSLTPAFVNRNSFDLHPAVSSAMINAGSAAGTSSSGVSLTPVSQYRHTAGSEFRVNSGAIDIGAYEAGAATVEAPTWSYCASENQNCNYTGTRRVRYGANGIFSYRWATGSIGCNNLTFGDPVRGVAKTCFYEEIAEIVVAPASPAPSLPTWVTCAGENGVCSFSGTRQVRYGANTSYAYRTATSSIACKNSIFGDPIFGVAKACAYAK